MRCDYRPFRLRSKNRIWSVGGRAGRSPGARSVDVSEHPPAWCSWQMALALVFCIAPCGALADDGPTSEDIVPQTIALSPYQNPGDRFLILQSNEQPPDGFEQPAFNDSNFGTGSDAFGSAGRCPLTSGIQTEWPINTELLIRRRVFIPAGARNVRVMVSIDNDILGIFFNGHSIADFTSHENCPIVDEFRFDVSPELVQPGDNLVVFHLKDRGEESFFDARILAEVAPDQLIEQLRQAAIVRQSPSIPITNVRVTCTGSASAEQSNIRIRYVVSGTGEPGDIRIEQRSDGLTVEAFLSDRRVVLANTTPEETTIERSPEAIERVAVADPGILSALSVLGDHAASQRLSRCLAIRQALSCEMKCDQAASRATTLARIFAEFAKTTVGGRPVRDDTVSSVGTRVTVEGLVTLNEAATKLRIATERVICLKQCPCATSQIRNQETGLCQCASGTEPDPSGGGCRTSCIEGQVRDANGACVCLSGRIIINGRCQCPLGAEPDPSGGGCRDICIGGQVRNANGACVCVSGQTFNSSLQRCVFPPCPLPGQVRDPQGVCAFPKCPEGLVRNSQNVCTCPNLGMSCQVHPPECSGRPAFMATGKIELTAGHPPRCICVARAISPVAPEGDYCNSSGGACGGSAFDSCTQGGAASAAPCAPGLGCRRVPPETRLLCQRFIRCDPVPSLCWMPQEAGMEQLGCRSTLPQ